MEISHKEMIQHEHLLVNHRLRQRQVPSLAH
jgi:hypothetical protein